MTFLCAASTFAFAALSLRVDGGSVRARRQKSRGGVVQLSDGVARRRKSLRNEVHNANAVVWEPV
eukprot:31490-Pelagococcus_subviridis.AAC.4